MANFVPIADHPAASVMKVSLPQRRVNLHSYLWDRRFSCRHSRPELLTTVEWTVWLA